MANKFEIKRNDTRPYLDATIQQANGSPVDLSTGSYIFFNMSTNDNAFTSVFSGAASIVGTGSDAGTVRYEWASSDTNRSGTYLGEFEVTYTDSTVLTAPADHSFVIAISEDYD